MSQQAETSPRDAATEIARLETPLQDEIDEQLLPIFLDISLPWVAGLLGLPFSNATVSHIQVLVFGALIMFFLIVEPHGLARLWQITKEKLRLWPFPH